MQVELTSEDLALIGVLLDQEDGETRVEIHHTKDTDYKEYLRRREAHVRDLLDRIRQATPA